MPPRKLPVKWVAFFFHIVMCLIQMYTKKKIIFERKDPEFLLHSSASTVLDVCCEDQEFGVIFLYKIKKILNTYFLRVPYP